MDGDPGGAPMKSQKAFILLSLCACVHVWFSLSISLSLPNTPHAQLVFFWLVSESFAKNNNKRKKRSWLTFSGGGKHGGREVCKKGIDALGFIVQRSKECDK